MRTRLTASVLRRGMTLVEVVVVIGIISIALPALFSTLIVSTRQQVSISRINEVKNQGDSVLGTMTSRIKNNADKLCISSTDHASCGTVVCGTATATPVTIDSFTDKSGTFVRYYLNAESLYESTGGVVKRLTNDRVKVSLLTIQCQKLSDTTRPIVSIQYTVLAEAVGNTKAEERATLDYSTKIAVDQIDSVTRNVSDVDPVIIAAELPSHTPYPTNTPTRIPTNTPIPSPTTPTTGDCTKQNASRTAWTATVDSYQSNSNTGAAALDGNTTTYWHTQFNPVVVTQPHWIRIDLGSSQLVECLKYLPRQALNDGNYTNGRILGYEIYISDVASSNVTDWGTAVATGTFAYDGNNIDKSFPVVLQPKRGRYVTLRSLSVLDNKQWTSVAEINLVVTTEPVTPYPVSGHVVDVLSSAGIAGVQVEIGYIDATGGTHSSTTNTQTDGTYSVTYVPVGSQYYVRIPYLTGADSQSIGKVGYHTRYTGSKATSPGTPTWWPTVAGQIAPVYEYATGQYAMHHTYWHITDNSGPSRDTNTSDVSYEWQRAGQNDCASAIASVSGQVWNYPAGRCDFRMSQ